jgi:UDP-N-acetylglucosamine diphosphorylase/glucosamine-1-phosphate N-acetyltransferase
LSGVKPSYLTQDYLSKKYQTVYADFNFYINGRVLPTKDLLEKVTGLVGGESIWQGDTLIAYASNEELADVNAVKAKNKKYEVEVNSIDFTYDIFSYNAEQIALDISLLTEGKTSQKLSNTNTLIGDNIFVEEGASVEGAIIDTTDGPVYLGRDTTVMIGSLIKGPFALCKASTTKMGAKISGGTTVGPHSKVGGEINNCVFQGYSNKGHDGFLGNSVIGEWCNLGADTNSSNLKNNYAEIKLWNYNDKRFTKTGLQFCGLIMGDHSKCGINTMFNTGTVVGVSSNIFGAGFPRNFIPSFTWGGASGFSTYAMGKAFETATRVMERRKLDLTQEDREILIHIFESTSEHRFWENKTLRT